MQRCKAAKEKEGNTENTEDTLSSQRNKKIGMWNHETSGRCASHIILVFLVRFFCYRFVAIFLNKTLVEKADNEEYNANAGKE